MNTYKILFRDDEALFREAYVCGNNKDEARLNLWVIKGVVKIISYNLVK